MVFYLVMGIIMMMVALSILLRKEVKMSNILLTRVNPVAWWISRYVTGNREPEKDFYIRGFARIFIGSLLFIGGISFLYYALVSTGQ